MDVPRGTTALEIAEKISPRLAKVVIAATTDISEIVEKETDSEDSQA